MSSFAGIALASFLLAGCGMPNNNCDYLMPKLRDGLACQRDASCWSPVMQESLDETWRNAEQYCFARESNSE